MTPPGPISHTVIQRQIRLPLRKAVEIALRSLRVRLTRSLLTLLTIAMGIAFLTYVWLSGVLEPGLQVAAQRLGGGGGWPTGRRLARHPARRG